VPSNWYVLRTKCGKEGFVAHQLASKGTDVFFPRLSGSVRIGGNKQQRVGPMFPSYLFVQMDPGMHGMDIRYTPGVKDFLRRDGAPEPVCPEIVSTLKERIGPSGVFRRPEPLLQPGMRLRIDDGPLRGMDVIFEQELSCAKRVAVLLAAVSLQARVVLSRESLVSA
jgi:transcriptional antiterminator RfaH